MKIFPFDKCYLNKNTLHFHNLHIYIVLHKEYMQSSPIINYKKVYSFQFIQKSRRTPPLCPAFAAP